MSQLQVTGEAKIRDIQGPVVANSGVITALDGAASQYVRGDGTLADFPTSTGGGSSVSYYLNSSVSQGTIGGVAYRELSKEPIIGAGTDITISANGYVASYITDANDPDVLSVPGGNFNCEFYFSVNNNTGNPTTYAELYKYDGTTFTLLGSSVAVPESLNQGTTIAPYYFAIPVATAALALTDRLAIRIYVNVDGRVVTLHTENSHLCQVVTTFSKGMVSLNNLTDQSQFITTGTSGTNFAIVSSGDTHTFNLPVASATNTGKLSNTDWSTFNAKQPAGNYVTLDTTQTITAEKTFSVSPISESGYSFKILASGTPFQNGYSLISSIEGSVSITQALSAGNLKAFTFDFSDWNINTTRTYTLPDASGTLALTSNLSSYVPYIGATGSVDLGAYSLSADTLNGVGIFSVGSGTQSGFIGIKQGTTFIGNISGYNSINANATKFILTSDIGSTNYKSASFQLGSLTNNTERTFTLPDLSGTLALLEGTQTFTGVKSFDTGILLKNGVVTTTSGYTGIGAGTSGINVSLGSGGGGLLIFQSTSYNYTFPASSGTIALTSNLSAYLPLTGGTLTGALSGTSATFSGNVTLSSGGDNLTLARTGFTSWGFGVGTVSGINGLHIGAGASTYLSLNQSTGAATFSSSVTANNTGGVPALNVRASDANFALASIFGNQAGDVNWLLMSGYPNAGDFTIRQSDVLNAITIKKTSGNVGIGTSSPDDTLHIAKNGTGSYTAAHWTNSSSTASLYVGVGGSGVANGSLQNNAYFYNVGNSATIFATNDTERMRITSGGDFEIPWANNIVNIMKYDNDYRMGLLYQANSRLFTLFSTGSDGGGAISFNTRGTAATGGATDYGSERMRITSGGTGLFATTTASAGSFATASFQVGNEVVSKGALAGFFWESRSGGVTSNSNWYGWYAQSATIYLYNGASNIASINTSSGAYTALSDVNKKKDFEASTIGLNAILGLKPTLYRMKTDDESVEKQLGFIAQEVKEFIPQAYTENGEGENKFIGLNDRPIIAALVKAVQEIKSEKDTEILELRNQISELKALIAAK